MFKPTGASRLFFCSVLFISTLTISACVNTNAVTTNKADNFTLKVFGINDFHGQILPKNEQGGMYNLGAHLLQAIEGTSDRSFILHAGDHVGASPAESALLQDEPAISFLNTISQYCANAQQDNCEVIGTLGNHEFDEGSHEMMRLLQGGNHHKGPFLEAQWLGAQYKMLSANVVDKKTDSLLLPPYVVQEVNGVDIGIIGLTLDTTPELVVPGAVDNLIFEDQAQVATRYIETLQKQGVNAIIIVVHDGTGDDYYAGDTQQSTTIDKASRFGKFLSKLPNTVDLVVSGHSHRFTNAYFTRPNGSQLLVTQAFSSGRAYADITLTIDKDSRDVSNSVAQVIRTDDAPSSSLSAAAIAALTKLDTLITASHEYAQAYTQTVINVYKPSSQEIPLGQFIADSHKYALKTDLAIMNRGGVRAGLKPGELTWGELFAVQPFGNHLVERQYTGKQLLSLIDTANFWSSNVAISANDKVSINGESIDTERFYTVAGNNYIMNSTAFAVGKQVRLGDLDMEATLEYIKGLKTPFNLNDTPN